MDDATELQVVDVRNRFDGTWSGGFAVVETLSTPEGPRYRVLRLSDGTVLWGLFGPEEIAESDEQASG